MPKLRILENYVATGACKFFSGTTTSFEGTIGTEDLKESAKLLARYEYDPEYLEVSYVDYYNLMDIPQVAAASVFGNAPITLMGLEIKKSRITQGTAFLHGSKGQKRGVIKITIPESK